MSSQREIWFDGEIVPWEQATVHVWDEVALRGASVFDGLVAFWRAGRGGHDVLALGAHLARLRRSAHLTDIPVPRTDKEIVEAITRLAHRFHGVDLYLRPTVFARSGRSSLSPGARAGMYIGAFPHLTPPQGHPDVTAAVSTYRRGGQDPVTPLAKAGGGYLDFRLPERERLRWAVDHMILLDDAGFVAEADSAGVLVVRDDGTLLAPAGDAPALRSITSDIVTRLAAELGFPVESRRVRREDLHTGTVVFAGTLLGVRRVRELDGVDRSAAGSWHSADLLVVAYRDLCAGRPELAKDLFTELAGGA